MKIFLDWQLKPTLFEALSQKLRDIVPDLLLSNHVISADYAGAIAIQLTSHRQELIEVAS